jgi:hypothetical protein
MDEKIRFVRRLIDHANLMARLLNEARDLHKAYFTRAYDSGGDAVLQDSDIAALEVTAAGVAAGVTLADNFVKFMTNDSAAAAADYAATLAKLRGDL